MLRLLLQSLLLLLRSSITVRRIRPLSKSTARKSRDQHRLLYWSKEASIERKNCHGPLHNPICTTSNNGMPSWFKTGIALEPVNCSGDGENPNRTFLPS